MNPGTRYTMFLVQTLKNVLIACKVSTSDDIREKRSDKNDAPKAFEASVLFFCHVFHECHFVLKFCRHAKICQSLQPKKSVFLF